MTNHDWLDKDFYKILGVSKDADKAAIKKAYHKLARKYHPDQNPGDQAAEDKFKEIGEAYAVLSDEGQRKQYDALRTMAGGGARFSAGPGGGAGGFEDIFSMFTGGGAGGNTRVRFSTSGSSGGFEDILSQMFGGAAAAGANAGGTPFGGFAGGAPGPRKGADLMAETELTLRQALKGTTLKMKVEGRTMTVRIPAGVHSGKKVRLRGQGRPSPNGGESGDLVVSIKVKPHPVFRIDGKHLRMDLPVSVSEAVLGAKVEIPLLDGESVKVKVPAGTPSGAVLRLRGRGATASGDLLVTVQIVVPTKLSRRAKKALATFADETADFDPRENLVEEARTQ
ncbi:MAG: DnaJ C-terminal domain-containing protein [Actinomycetaceae bacterium]|nr:DnaJ C-terminal domain-containing protein [Actinomycetaceae bacterium]